MPCRWSWTAGPAALPDGSPARQAARHCGESGYTGGEGDGEGDGEGEGDGDGDGDGEGVGVGFGFGVGVGFGFGGFV